MKISLRRQEQIKDATIGRLYINGRFQCYTLEDIKRKNKIWGKTRIPAGIYKVTLRQTGSTHWRYLKRFPSFHVGMLHLQNVGGFKYILIHIGNWAKDTAGCILVGLRQQENAIFDSTDAYKKIYLIISNAIIAGEDVEIEVRDEQ